MDERKSLADDRIPAVRARKSTLDAWKTPADGRKLPVGARNAHSEGRQSRAAVSQPVDGVGA